MDHARLEEAIAAFALGALDEAERVSTERALLEHVPGCESCRVLWADAREVAGDLALVATPRAVPADLEERILSKVRGEGAPAPASVARGARAGRSRLLSRLAVAALAAAVMGLGAWNVQLSSRVSDTSDRANAVADALALVSAPDARSVRLAGPEGTLVFVHRAGEAMLVGHNVAAPPPGRVLQLWLMRANVPTSVAVFRPSDGVVVLPLRVDPDRYEAVAITVERGPRGASQPTTTPVFFGSLSA